MEEHLQRLEKSLIMLHHVFRNHHGFIKKKFKIAGLEMEIIQFLSINGPCKMKEVSQYFHIKLSTLTSIIDKAERQRLLKRVNSKQDRRVVYLETTHKGRQIYDEYAKYLKEISSRLGVYFDEQSYNHFMTGIESLSRITT